MPVETVRLHCDHLNGFRGLIEAGEESADALSEGASDERGTTPRAVRHRTATNRCHDNRIFLCVGRGVRHGNLTGMLAVADHHASHTFRQQVKTNDRDVPFFFSTIDDWRPAA